MIDRKTLKKASKIKMSVEEQCQIVKSIPPDWWLEQKIVDDKDVFKIEVKKSRITMLEPMVIVYKNNKEIAAFIIPKEEILNMVRSLCLV